MLDYLSGIQVQQVEPGTEIEDDKGPKLKVTDRNSVSYKGTYYVTPKTYRAIKDSPEIKDRPRRPFSI